MKLPEYTVLPGGRRVRLQPAASPAPKKKSRKKPATAPEKPVEPAAEEPAADESLG